MKKNISLIIGLIIFSLARTSTAATITTSSALEQYATQLIEERALLGPIGAIGDPTQYVAEIDDNFMCGISGSRLKIFRKDNIENVISSCWMPDRFAPIFEYYKGHIYLPQRQKGIWIFDVRNPSRLSLVTQLDIPLANHAKIEIKEDKLFCVDSEDNALVILSLANPAQPEEISRCLLSENMRGNYKSSMTIIDNRIYILGTRAFAIYDCEDLYSPRLLDQIDLKSGTGRGPIVVSDPYVYIYDVKNEEIWVFDTSTPDANERKATVKARVSCAYAVLRDDHITNFGENGVHIYDITDPLKPELVRHHYNNMPGDFLISKSQDYIVNDNGKAEPLIGLPYFSQGQSRFGFAAHNIVIRDNFAYVFAGDSLQVFDVSHPWNPKHIGKLTPDWGSGARCLSEGNYLYTPQQIIDISKPTKPTVVKKLSYGSHAAVNNKHLFVAAHDQLHVWDIQTPAKAECIKNIPLDKEPTTLLFHEGILYMGFREAKLRSCVLEEDLTLTTLDEIDLAKSKDGTIIDLCAEDDLLYAALNKDGIASVDVNDPQNLKVHARFDTQCARQIEVVDAFAYVADGSGGTLIIDMAEKGKEKQIASYPTTHYTTAIAVSGHYVYSGDKENGITVFVANPSTQQ